MKRHLKKAPAYGPLSGVCAGIGYALDVPVPIVRLVFIVVFIASTFFPAVIIYYIFSFVLPEWDPVPDDFETATGEHDRTRPF